MGFIGSNGANKLPPIDQTPLGETAMFRTTPIAATLSIAFAGAHAA